MEYTHTLIVLRFFWLLLDQPYRYQALSIASDEADKGSSPGDTGGDKNLLDALNFTPTGGSIEEIFKANYQIVNRCNQALYFIPQLHNADQANLS